MALFPCPMKEVRKEKVIAFAQAHRNNTKPDI